MDLDFIEAAEAAGVSTRVTCSSLHHIAEMVLAGAKHYARALNKRHPALGHRRCLEYIAKACQFPDWHAMQTLCVRLTQHERNPGKYPEALRQAFPLLLGVPAELAPTAAVQRALDNFAGRIAVVADMSHEAARDWVATLYDAPDWSSLVSRTPEQATGPLYSFVVERWTQKSVAQGHFIWSPACAALVEAIDLRWQRYSARPKAEQRAARRYVEQLLAKRPDFLEGWLARASMAECDDEETEAGKWYLEGYSRSEALIPADFKGQLSWLYIENRFYLRLLFNYMRWCLRNERPAKAATFARKLLRLDPSDSWSCRRELAIALTCAANFDRAEVATRKLLRGTGGLDAVDRFVVSLCELAAGHLGPQPDSRVESGTAHFLTALLQLPALRPLLLERRAPHHRQEPEYFHGQVPDFESLWFYWVSIVLQFPISQHLTLVLQRAEVKRVEKESALRYAAVRAGGAGRGGTEERLQAWLTYCEEAGAATATALLAR